MSAFNVEVSGGGSVRLPTAGKYCDRDIVVQATGGGDGKLPGMVERKVEFELTADELGQITAVGSHAFYYHGKLTAISLPVTVTDIERNAFEYCSALASVTLNEGLKTIGSRAFIYCYALKSITVPGSVTDISVTAFSNCSKLERVIMRGTVPPTVAENSFNSCSKLTQIIVPTGCGAAYRSATNWSKHADIIVEEGEA